MVAVHPRPECKVTIRVVDFGHPYMTYNHNSRQLLTRPFNIMIEKKDYCPRCKKWRKKLFRNYGVCRTCYDKNHIKLIICIVCKRKKPNRGIGMCNHCWRKQYREKHLEHEKETRRLWYIKNKEHESIYGKNYWVKNDGKNKHNLMRKNQPLAKCPICNRIGKIVSITKGVCRICMQRHCRYKISYEDLKELYKQVNCIYCNTDLTKLPTNKINLDHNHYTGKITGFACWQCNIIAAVCYKKDDWNKFLKIAEIRKKEFEEWERSNNGTS